MWSLRGPASEEDDMWFLRSLASEEDMWFLRSLAALASPELIKKTDLVSSKWFSRGWTLQELIAPNSVTFFDREWEEIGTRATVSTTIALATSIDEPLLNWPRCKPDENLRFLRQQLEAIAALTE